MICGVLLTSGTTELLVKEDGQTQLRLLASYRNESISFLKDAYENNATFRQFNVAINFSN